MDIDLIGEVKKTENIADEIIINAEKVGQEKLTIISAEMNKNITDTKDILKQSTKAKIEDAKKEAESKIKELEQNKEKEIKRINTLDANKVQKAVNIIIETLNKRLKTKL